MTKNDWINTVVDATQDFELYFDESHVLSPRTEEEIEQYINYFINKDHIKSMPHDVQSVIKEKWASILKIFNENHKYLGYDIVIFRKQKIFEEPELFISN